MSTKLFYFLLLIGLVACQSPKENTIDYVLFSGTITNPSSDVVKLMGNEFKAELSLDDSNSFSDTLWIPLNGYYIVAAGRESSSMFLNTGDVINMTIDVDQFDETIHYEGKGAEKNNYLAKKYLLKEQNSPSFDEFFAADEYEFNEMNNSLHTAEVDLLMESDIKDKNFVEMEKKALKYDFLSNISNYEEYHEYLTKDADYTVSDGFYTKLEGFDYENEADFKTYRSYQTICVNHYIIGVDSKEDLEKTFDGIQSIKSEYIKNELLTNFRYSFSPAHEELDLFYSLLLQTSTDEDFKKSIKEKYAKISPLTKGNVSPTFSYPTKDGDLVSLEDLKGKFVYVDVWATWCGPCKREIPHLKQLTSDYSGKDIEFVSISIDPVKDRDKWISMLEEKEMEGIQLFADKDWKSEFVLDYAIEGIPRFILIDKEGNIVSADEARPSDPALREKIDNLL